MAETSVSAATFRAKAMEMKAWKPENPPSNRDRLLLYALHKQAVSGDAPETIPLSSEISVHEKAKLQAWQTKRGLEQAEAMNLYVAECDRQMRVYGSSTSPQDRTPTNTPAVGAEEERDEGAVVPRGLAAVPLLCAAAAESRSAYLDRLAKYSMDLSTQGWWEKQEPLCADPGTPQALPENLVLFLASKNEYLSLRINDILPIPIPLSTLQSFLWPLHNVLIAVWILLIFVCTLVGSTTLTARTILFGSKQTGVTLPSLFTNEVIPSRSAASSLCEPHQAISVRLAGLALLPLVTVCDVSNNVAESAGYVFGGAAYIIVSGIMWWYWFCVLPWCAGMAICVAVMSGWCFALIEFASAL